MENFEYEREYPFPKGLGEYDADEVEAFRALLFQSPRPKKEMIHLLIPYAPKLFQQMLVQCDKIARTFCGKVKAVVDYTKFVATIELWCCYVDFDRGELLHVLSQLSLYANSIHFLPLTSGDLYTRIELPYFLTLPYTPTTPNTEDSN